MESHLVGRNKVIIAGGRDFNNYDLLQSSLYNILRGETEIVSGRAYGADRLGEKFANLNGIKLTLFPANWDKYGKSAGYIRNKEMAEYADSLVAFWDGKSKGTKHMIDLATKKGLKVKIVNY